MKLTFASIKAASARIASKVHRTPVLTSRTVDRLVGCEVFFKAEFLQKTGSFKARGAYNAVMCLSDSAVARGVITHSSGNHGQALAAAAQDRGIPCTVVVPWNCPQVKIDAMKNTYSAHVVLCEPTQESRANTVTSEVAFTGATFVPPYDHFDIMAGQGTLGLELMDQAPGLDAVLVPTSGGGMIAGVATACKGINEDIKVVAVEPFGKRLGDSLATGKRVVDEDQANVMIATVADAIRTMAIGSVPWETVLDLVEPQPLTVNDTQITSAMQFAFERMKIVIEPAAATGLAALLDGQLSRIGEGSSKRIGVVLCGGNVDVTQILPWQQQ